MHIDHIAIWTMDLEKEKKFFLKYFDCTANELYINSLTRFSSYFITLSGGARIELMNRPEIDKGSENHNAGFSHFAINAGTREAVDALTGRLEMDGYVIAGKPRITGDGYYESVILDPEGNRIEIISV